MIPQKIEISSRTILFILGLLLTFWFLLQIREIIFYTFVSFIFMAALNPFADRLERYKIPRAVAALCVYVVIIAIFAFIGNAIIPDLVGQSTHFIQVLPEFLKTTVPFITIDPQTISQQLTPVGENLFKVTVGVFSNIITLFTIIVISFYLLIERKYLSGHLTSFLGKVSGEQITNIIIKIEDRLGAWVRGQLALGALIGCSVFIGLTILGLPFALPLSIIAGIMEIIPIIGPIISAIPGIIVGLTVSPLMALAATAMYFLIQQAEAHVIFPLVMKRAIGLPPLVTILALMIGAKLAGVTGALLSVPLVVTGEIIVSEYLRLKSSK